MERQIHLNTSILRMMNSMLIRHEDLVEDEGLLRIIPVSVQGWDNLIIKIGKVNIKPSDDLETAVLEFDYDVIKGELKPEDKAAFETSLGDELIQELEQQLVAKEAVYHGGLDEIRDSDTE